MTSLKGALGWLLAMFACLFELVLSLFLLGVGIIAWVSDSNILAFGKWIILTAGIVGLASVLLAGSRLRWIFPLWCLFVLAMLVRGFFLSSYSFGSKSEFQFVVGLTIGALIAFLGSLRMLRRRPARR
jgi:hypothetical protein